MCELFVRPCVRDVDRLSCNVGYKGDCRLGCDILQSVFAEPVAPYLRHAVCRQHISPNHRSVATILHGAISLHLLLILLSISSGVKSLNRIRKKVLVLAMYGEPLFMLTSNGNAFVCAASFALFLISCTPVVCLHINESKGV